METIKKELCECFSKGYDEGLNLRRDYNDPELLKELTNQALDDLLSFLDKPLSATPKQKNQ